jgi:hypothetical protein
MVPSVRIALTTCIALMVVGIEARKTQRSGPIPAPPDPYRAAIFSFAAMSVFLILSACAEPPAPRAALPAQRNVSALSPDPCATPNLAQPYGRDIVSVVSPHLRSSNMRCPDYSRGLPSLGADWTRPEPTREPSQGNVLGRTEANRYWEAERFRQEKEDFQRRQRTGR